MSRLQKYNKQRKKKLIFMSKMVIVFYLVIFSFSYLTGGTIAYFSNANQGIVKFTAGIWFDGSKLQFVGNNGTQVKEACSVIEISAPYKNVGNKMQGPGRYEIFYTEPGSKGNGSPENHGTSIYEGEFRALEKNEVITLTFDAQHEGDYVFKVYQREGFEGKEKEKVVESNKFKIQCKEKKSNEKENAEVEETDTVINEEKSNTPQTETQQKTETVEELTEEQNSGKDSPESDTPEQSSQNNTKETNEPENNSVNPLEKTTGEANNTNKQPTGEGEGNEEAD